jgi:hypothetical protein
MFKVPEKFRVRYGALGSDESYGNNGAFEVTLNHGQKLRVIASDMFGWEHVSVSRKDRCPTWDEMCQVKDLFWGPEDAVMQLHPKESEYVNNHPYCLHLWRPVDQELPLPPAFMVGVKSLGKLEVGVGA